MFRLPARSTLFPYTTLFRSLGEGGAVHVAGVQVRGLALEGDGPAVAADPRGRGVEVARRRRGAVDAAQQGVRARALVVDERVRSEEHTSELQSLTNLVCRLL